MAKPVAQRHELSEPQIDVEIVLVANGPAVDAFHELQASDRVSDLVKFLRAQGVQFNACGNTMRSYGYELFDLLAGFVRLEQGGVARIAQLQQEGYVYIRP